MGILARAHEVQSPISQPIDTLCSICKLPQFDSPGGTTCINGHGGAEAFVSFQRPYIVRPANGGNYYVTVDAAGKIVAQGTEELCRRAVA
jgi:hypothetical protein